MQAYAQQCPKHPMSALSNQKNAAHAERDRLVAALSKL
jgi:hypothetical protein